MSWPRKVEIFEGDNWFKGLLQLWLRTSLVRLSPWLLLGYYCFLVIILVNPFLWISWAKYKSAFNVPTISLNDFAVNERVLVEITKGIYGLFIASRTTRKVTARRTLGFPRLSWIRDTRIHIYSGRERCDRSAVVKVAPGSETVALRRTMMVSSATVFEETAPM